MVGYLRAASQQQVSRYIVIIPVWFLFVSFVWKYLARKDNILLVRVIEFVLMVRRTPYSRTLLQWSDEAVIVWGKRSTNGYARVRIYQEYGCGRHCWVS